MLSVSMLASGVRAVAASMLSPEKNPCRVRVSESESGASNWYRYDPYVSKVLPSPLKTRMSPVKAPSPALAVDEAPRHRNSLFSKPAAAAPVPVAAQQPLRSFLAAAEAKAPAPVAAVGKRSVTTESPTTHYAVVYFKHDSATFVAPFRVQAGDHVIVEGDRGVDIGRVTEITTVTPTYRVPLKIVRRATSKDMEAFQQKQRKEQLVQRQVQTLAESLSLGIQVVDTEFQFDNNKLTVFFAGRSQIDFRKLQRSLFREHRCRIWLSNMAEIEYNANLQKVRRSR